MSKYPNTLGRIEAVWNKIGGEDGVDRFLGGKTEITEVVQKIIGDILELVGTIKTLATTSKFVAKTRFVVNTDKDALVKISGLGSNFELWFLNGDGKTEDSISEQRFRYHKLRQFSVDGPIIAELGGAEKSETTLSGMFSLMEKQKHGEDGVLLNNGYANIFYIKDNAGVLRTVSVRCRAGGWRVDAYSVESPSRWRDGYQVFSRNSVLESSETSVPAQA